MADMQKIFDKNLLSFDDHWPVMQPIILKLLHQEAVTRTEWQDLFWLVHIVCLWDDKGPPKVYSNLQENILDFIRQAQTVSKVGVDAFLDSSKILFTYMPTATDSL
ncbi:Cullin-5 [Araneus ventricosus]|uniref:Cullin-5 n=1 Tax=Araneus ventricosus TaxID=182803 RepID=A0A4Y2HKA7_ARAVE|nr:Cullin-5 [Araneus ventricosus]